jgi:hypothetical protein
MYSDDGYQSKNTSKRNRSGKEKQENVNETENEG